VKTATKSSLKILLFFLSITVHAKDMCNFINSYLLTYGAEPLLRSRQLCQELPNILWKPKLHYRIHKSPPLVPVLGQIVYPRNPSRSEASYEEFVAPSPTPKLEDHPLSAVRDCLFNIFAATLHIWRPSPPSTTWGRAMPWWQGTHLTWNLNAYHCKIKL
jgi:hypothetical protein